MSSKKKTPRTRKRKPVEIDDGGAFARHFEEMIQTIFRDAGRRPEPAKIINLNEWRKGKN